MKPDHVHIEGAELKDVAFKINVPDLPPLSWNVTRIQRDADAGLFGKPLVIPTSVMPKLTNEMHANVDWFKVQAMIMNYAQWCADGKEPLEHIINKPSLHVMLRTGPKQLMRIPVDGNHRIMARILMGAADFQTFVVPSRLEEHYRIRTFINGVEVHDV